MREIWAAYSVTDHLAKKAFVADVMLYDRLVIPIPAATITLGGDRTAGTKLARRTSSPFSANVQCQSFGMLNGERSGSLDGRRQNRLAQLLTAPRCG
jgi:hypothetical protein